MEDDSHFADRLRTAVLAARETATSSVRAHNRLMDAVQRELDQLAGTEAGRDLLLSLATSERDLDVRIASANAVMKWDPGIARTSLEDILRDAGAEVVWPMTMDIALKAPWGHARSAALSLLNLNRRSGNERVKPTIKPELSQSVPSSWLDAAERVYNLAMNGGLEHAFDLAEVDFSDACLALDAVGAADAATVFREAHELLQGHQHPQNLEELLSTLDSRLADMAVIEFLEAANER